MLLKWPILVVSPKRGIYIFEIFYKKSFITSITGLKQCDQIGRFIALWSIFQSLCQQWFCPNRPHCLAIFVKASKLLIFLVNFFGQLYRHLAIFSGHTRLQTKSDKSVLFLIPHTAGTYLPIEVVVVVAAVLSPWAMKTSWFMLALVWI